ncbi:MAG: ATP synthase F1 subunit delta [bacterium JZ-2024 1]
MAIGQAERRFIALRYAEGFYEAARKENLLERGLAFVEHLTGLFERYPDLLKVLEHPQVTKAEKQGILERACGPFLEPSFRSFAQLILRRQRLRLIPEIAERYREKWESEHGILKGEVRSALPLDEFQRRSLEEVFSRKYGKKVILEERLDPEAIGGVAVILEGKILDGTLRNKLEHLKQVLLSDDFWKARAAREDGSAGYRGRS